MDAPAAFVLFVCLVAANVWATQRVLNASSRLHGKGVWLIAGIWMMPVVGVLLARSHTRVDTAPVKKPQQPRSLDETLPTFVSAPDVPDFDLMKHLYGPRGLPALNWAAFDEWASGIESEPCRRTAREQARDAWLQHLRHAMSPDATLTQSEHALVLSTLEPEVASAAANYIEKTRARVASLLAGLAKLDSEEPSVLLVFDSGEDYYDYVSVYYPDEGEFATSGGMYIHAGCPHFVVVRAELSQIEPTIAHEMTHSALAHLHLPKWLDEGIAVNTEIRLTGEKRLIYTPHELHEKHQAFWNADRIQEFWSGQSFDRTDDGNLLSYELGRIIVEQMARDWDSFLRFVATARRDDAAQGASLEVYGSMLGFYPATLLGSDNPRSWDPRPEAWTPAAPSTSS